MDLPPLYLTGFAAATTLLLLILFRAGQVASGVAGQLATDLRGGNAARRMVQVGQVLAIFLVAAAAVKNCAEGASFLHDVLWVSLSGVAGLVLVVATETLAARLLLRSSLPAEIERGNVAAGLASGAHYVATGIITSRALAGNDAASLGLAFVFFVLAQVTLHAFIILFRALTTYDDAEQIRGENLAAALSYGGIVVGVSLIVARAVEGNFVSWSVSLRGYAEVLLGVLALYPVRQLFVQTLVLGGGIVLRGGRIDTAIAVERNPGVGALEAATYLATALSFTRLS